ncbi:hypothetical protein K3740_08675 [Ruegeria conchae]|uniref:hypothetical protein n=1 Tax=Ruegeria conchae TaxID=981384 RepID=UPI0021A3DB95|nr:hypothetical protein [Ruegeria conchae]UWR04734.1 hypothetical protein K3740_08675 [Ruegeria conchae]
MTLLLEPAKAKNLVADAAYFMAHYDDTGDYASAANLARLLNRIYVGLARERQDGYVVVKLVGDVEAKLYNHLARADA